MLWSDLAIALSALGRIHEIVRSYALIGSGSVDSRQVSSCIACFCVGFSPSSIRVFHDARESQLLNFSKNLAENT